MEEVVERGWGGASLDAVLRRAGVDPGDFPFADLRECCREIYVANIAEFDRIVFAAVDAANGWPERLRASAYAALRYVGTRPIEAHFNFIEMLEGGEAALVYRDRYVNRIVDLIDEGRSCRPDPDSVSRDLAASVFGSIYLFLQGKLGAGEDIATIERYVPELMYTAVLPYLGSERALAELSIPPPPPDRVKPPG